MAQPHNEREARKQYVRRRQRVVFTVIGVILVTALIIALLFQHHILGTSQEETPAAQPNYGVTSVCAPKDADGNASNYVDNSSVKVRVLNGTKFSGFAQAVSEALENRSFTISEVNTYSNANVERTTIYFGKNSVAQAYTLAANFTDAVLVMDNRTDMLIDLVLGATFSDLKELKKVPAAGTAITDIKGCKTVDSFKDTDLKEAIKHDAVQ